MFALLRTVGEVFNAAIFNREPKRVTRIVIEDPDRVGYLLMPAESTPSRLARELREDYVNEGIADFQRHLAVAEGRPAIPDPED